MFMELNKEIITNSILENKYIFIKNDIISIFIFGSIASDNWKYGDRIELAFEAKAIKGKGLMMMLYQRELILEVLNIPGLEAHHILLLKKEVFKRLKNEGIKIY